MKYTKLYVDIILCEPLIDKDNRGVVYEFFKKETFNEFLVLNKNMYNSTYIQFFALENYDKSLFESVILNPLSKIYRLKI